MPGNESYEDPYTYIATPRPKSASRGRGRTSKSRNYNTHYEGSSRPDGSTYREYSVKDEECGPTSRKRIKASHYENFVRKHPGGTKLCLLCKLEDNQLNCQGILKWYSVKSKRGPGRPKDKGQPKTPRLVASFLSNTLLEIAPAPKVITLKTEAGAHSEPIKIKIDMSKGGECLPNGNGFLDPDVVDTCGFYIHVECCRWTSSVTCDIEMFKAERYLLKGLGQMCTHCHMNGATVCCRFESCKKKFHVVCGLLAKCVPDMATSSMICSEHLVGPSMTGTEVLCSKCHEDKCHNSMLHCMTCGSHTHQQCLSADVQMRPLVVAGWQCDSCRSCQVCRKQIANSATPVIDCVDCSKPYHLDCIGPQQQGPQWRCKICRNCTDCGKEVPRIQIATGFILPFVLCTECHGLRMKGVSCCICYKAMYNELESTRCESCKCWLHPACESIDPELLDINNIYLCPVCRPGGRVPVVSRAVYNACTDNGQMVEPDPFDENSQDSMSITSENDEMSVTPVSSSHNSPGSSSLDSFYTVMPTKKGRLGVGIKLSRPPNRKMPKILSGEGSFQEKRDGVLANEVVLYNESDQYTNSKDMCVMCGSIGAKEDGLLLICQQCAKCYHSYCINKNITDTMFRIGWRCKECQICEGCSKASDESRLLLCEDCDISFHTYCLTPPLEQVPTGPWRCSWCVKCVKCNKATPGVHATWHQDYSVCGPCQSQLSCIHCNQEYIEGEFLIKCFSCEHLLHGKCESIPSEDNLPKKFVCSQCEEMVKKEGKMPSKKLQSTTFSATKQALNSVIKHDARIVSYMDKDEKEFEAERDEREKSRILGYDYIKALNKQRHEMQLLQKNKKFSGQDKDQKVNPMIEAGLTPSKELSSSTTYQQIIREITGGQQGNKAANKRGRGRTVNKANDLMSPTKDPNAPRVRGRPRGSRNKTSSQRNRGKGLPHPDILQQQLSADDNIAFADYAGMGVPRPPPPNIKSPLKTPLKRSNSNKGRGKLIPQIMDSSAQMIKQEISPAKMNSEMAMTFFGDELMPGPDMMSPPPPATPQMMAPQPMGPPMPLPPPLPSSPVHHPGTPMMPTQSGNPMMPTQSGNPMMPTQPGNPMMPTQPGNPMMPTQSGNPMMPTQSGNPMMPTQSGNPMMPTQPGKPQYNVQIKPRSKPPPSPLLDPIQNKSSSVPPSPNNPPTVTLQQPSPKPPTPIIKKEPEPFDLSKVNIDDIHVCPESPLAPDHPDTLPDYNNRELVVNKPVGQEVEEEEKMDEAVSSYFAGLFGDDDLEEEKGSPVFNPPDPNAEQLTLKNMEDLDEGNGELPIEVNAILESIEAKPIGTELDDGEPWAEKGKAQNSDDLPSNQLVPDLELGDEFLGLQLEGFDFPGFFDDITMKKLETEHRKTGPNDRSDFDKILDPPVPATLNKRPAANVNHLFKAWKEEEEKGNLGTVPQLLYANNNPEMNILKAHCHDSMERYRMIHRSFNKLSKEEKKIYLTNSKKNKMRKSEPDYATHIDQPPATPSGGWQQFEANRMQPQDPDKLSVDDQEMLRQSQRERRQRLYERHPTNTRHIKEGMIPGNDPMMGGWQARFRGPDDASSSTVTVGPIPSKAGMSNQMPPSRDGTMTPGPMTPGPMTPGPIRSPMTPRGMSPMNVQMMQAQNPMMGGPGYIQRHFDHNTGQWVHTAAPGAHTPLRHLPPQAIMAQQNMAQYNHMEQFAMQRTPEPPVQPPPKPKSKRTKKKKEKAPVEPPVPTPMDPQVNLENFPPHLRFGGSHTPAPSASDFQGTGPGHPGFEYNEHFRQNLQMPGMPNPLTKNFKPGNSPLLKSPQTAVEMERPKSLNINNNSPSATPKSHPNTPSKGAASKTSSPLTKTEDFSQDAVDSQQQMQQKQAIRIALEQRKQQQSHFMNQQMMISSNLHFPMNVPQFVQFRMQQDWLKKFNTCKATGGGLPPVPQHPNNLSTQQIQVLYNRLMENVMFSMAGSRMAMGPGGHPGMMEHMAAGVEEDKKPKPKKRKKKKAETPVKKDDKSKMPKIGPNLVMQTAMGPGPLGPNSPQATPDGFMGPHNMAPNSMGFQQGMANHMAQNMPGQGGGPHLGIINPNQKHLNMRSPGPALMAGPHVSHIPGQIHQQQRLMAPHYAIALSRNSDPRHIRPTLTQSPHFHDNYDIEPPRTPKPPSKSKSKSKTKESLQLSVPKSAAEQPMQADSPRYQFETPRYQHQIKIEDNQDFSDAKSPQSQRSQTPSSAGTPTMKDPFDNPPLTPSMYNSLDSAKRRKRRTKAEMDEIRAERERIGFGPPIRAANKNIPPVLQPDIGKMVDIVVRGTGSNSHCKLVGSYGRAVMENQRDYYRDLVTQIKQAKEQKESTTVTAAPVLTAPKPQIPAFDNKEAAKFHKQHHMEKLRATIPVHHAPTVLTPQQEKMLCQKFGVTPAEAQRMYYYQQHQHMMALREQQIKAYQMQEHIEQAKNTDTDNKSKILEQIRLLQESREKNSIIRGASPAISMDKIKQEENVSVSVKQQSDTIQLIFQRPVNEKQEAKEAVELEKPAVIKPHKPMLELTKPTPPTHIKQEYIKDVVSSDNSMSPRELPFAITGPDFTPTIKPCNPPTDEKTTRVINLHKAFQMLSDMLGMKLKKDNLASLNELRVQNIIPGSLPHNLVCYNCIIVLHPNKLKQLAPGRPYYGIKDEHGATFCCDGCLAQYYCKKFSSLRTEDEAHVLPRSDHMICNPPPLRQHLPNPSPCSPAPKPLTSPGKRRRESESWKYWKFEGIGVGNIINSGEEKKRLFELFRKWHEEHTAQTDAVDQRVCLLCGAVGDGSPNGPSRLLNYRKNTWIHLNCALWSNDVYETRDGELVNISQICKRAQDTACSYCSRKGASIVCFKGKCSATYHFLCARHTKCAFYTNKTVYCAAHRLPGQVCSDFTVRRRVVIEKDVQQLLSNEGFKNPGDKIRIGPMIFHHPGHILNNTSNFHTRNIIYPFDYSATRIFWSTEDLGKRCPYQCSIDIRNEAPLFKASFKKQDKAVDLDNTCVDALWKEILDSIADLRAKTPEILNLHVKFHPGSFLHGLTERNMLRIIEGLPGSDKLDGYTFCYGRIETVTLEHLVPFNPSQSARTEKYTKHTKRVGGHRQISSSIQGSQPPSLWSRELGMFHDMLPYQKSFNRASQYRRLKTEWKLNVLLRRSGIQGLGLYARRFIDRNTMVIEYVGQLIRTSLCDQREIYYNGKNIGCYMFKIDDVVAVDATMTGGPARYINHSCEPNCVAEIVTFEREKKIIIISNRKIRQGEELTYDYKFDFEDDSEKIPCNCGSVICRKWMN